MTVLLHADSTVIRVTSPWYVREMGLFKKKPAKVVTPPPAPRPISPYFPNFEKLGRWIKYESHDQWNLHLPNQEYRSVFGLRAGHQLMRFSDIHTTMTDSEKKQARENGARVEVTSLAVFDAWIFHISGIEGGRELLAERFDKYWRETMQAGKTFDMSLPRPYRFEDIPFENGDD